MSLKLHLRCMHCEKIFKDAISLPCGHTICNEHLREHENTIRCVSCSKEFDVTSNTFPPSHVVIKLIDDNLFLSEDERDLKAELLQSIIKLNELNKNAQNELDSFNFLI